ncbi:hypothetical protein [Amycolatopsis sp. NPDC102389]|uniref:hypothetical protein n=1 Tax=Amycolatopsis sp. NPDC102389 TaxID=3363941 RepID=UPI003804FC72
MNTLRRGDPGAAGRRARDRADVTDEAAFKAALDAAAHEHGEPDVAVYNAAIIQADTPGELSVHTG